MKRNGIKALIAMSGGVDSSVAAALMTEQGYECMGITMKLHDQKEEDSYGNTCCTLSDVEDARSVAFRLGMPFHVFNMQGDFNQYVIGPFVEAYENGATPNPCIECNRHLKFEGLFRKGRELGYDYVVTGHYARIAYDEKRGRFLLKKGVDETKDQSYVLYSMTQDQLAHTLFPLGEYRKAQIREMAAEKNFLNADKKESQDICFIPDGDYVRFIREYTGKDYPAGNFVTDRGEILGTHKGIIGYTIGQRKGLGLSLKAPLYVCEKRISTNEVVLSDESKIMHRGLIADNFNWISMKEPAVGLDIPVYGKTRYRQKEALCNISVLPDHRVKVIFQEPVRAITEGQAVVLYQGDEVVGGGTIRQIIFDME